MPNVVFFVTVIKCHDQGSLYKEKFIWVMVPDGEPIMAGEAW